MQLKRPYVLLVQHQERPAFSMESLLSGGVGVESVADWIGLAPHIGRELALELEDLALLDALTPGTATERVLLESSFGNERVERLVEMGLLIGDHDEHRELRRRDQLIRDTGWWAPAAVAHSFGRWRDVDVAADEIRDGRRTLESLIEENGIPPPASIELRDRATWQTLPSPTKTPLDDLLVRRATCRNFDSSALLPLEALSALLHRVFGAQAVHAMGPSSVALKKNSPSGGGLHPIEAFVLVQRVEGLASGTYHYQSTSHALEPMAALPKSHAALAAHELVAGQAWFADAPVLILMAARFGRNYWKYRNHAKAWKVIQLDAGHLSQNIYLSAAERGYGAFITGAINDECAERLFELDGLATGAVAVCGYGIRSETVSVAELDPLGKSRP